MAGWPWPLDGVQDWFESLWNWISSAATIAVSVVSGWIWEAINLIRDKVTSSIGWLKDTLWSGIQGISGWIWEAINLIRDSVSNGLNWLSSSLGSLIHGVSTWIWEGTNLIRDSVSNGLNWLSTSIGGLIQGVSGWIWEATNLVRNKIADGLKEVYSFVSNQVGSALETIKESVSGVIDAATSGIAGAIDAVVGPFTAVLSGIANILALVDPAGLANRVTAIFTGISFSPEAPAIDGTAEARRIYLKSVNTWAVDLNNQIHGLATTGAVIEAASMGQVDQIISQFMNVPKISAFSAAAKEIWTMEFQAKMGIQANQAFLATYTPMVPAIMDAQRMLWREEITMDQFRDICKRWGYGPLFEGGYVELTKQIPGAADLVRMVVREAFDPKVVVEAPSIFAEYMAKQGFAKEWSDRHWTAHFLPIALGQAYANLWRGFWDKEQFMFALHIADIHPMWREDIYNVAFRPPGVRELGYGFDTGLYSVEDIIRYRRWGGLSPEDAEKAGRSMVAYRTEAEREALRREALADYVAGLDTEENLRAKLTAIGGRPEIIDLWVARAQYRTVRDLTLDLVKVVTTDFIKGWSTETEFRQDLIELGVVPERRDVIIREAQARRLSYKREAAAEKNKLLTSAKISKARELGLIGDAEFIRRHMAANYTEDDARLLLTIELTPRPVTVEEIERRRATVTSRLNRATRRWETRLAGIQDQIDITALQLKDAAVTRDESLDVIDAQIAVYDTLIAEAEEERVEALEARRTVLFQRRELAEATWADRIRRLTEQHTNLVEEKALMIQHRDEELKEYTDELDLLVVAG